MMMMMMMWIWRISLLLLLKKSVHTLGGQREIEKCLRNATSVSFIGCIICSREKTIRRRPPYELRDRKNSELATGDIFDKIYQSKVWGDGGGGSGVGSIPGRAIGAGHILRLVIFKLGLTSLLDAPCGAVHASWTKMVIRTLKEELPCFKYHGVDVAETVVKKNLESLSPVSLPWIDFSVIDLASANASLPRGYDVILSRDALQHLSYKHIATAFSSYCYSDARYLLVGSYLDAPPTENFKNIETGGCFAINLLSSPFSFSNPLDIYPESAEIDAVDVINTNQLPRKFLLLYDLRAFCSDAALHSYIRQYK